MPISLTMYVIHFSFACCLLLVEIVRKQHHECRGPLSGPTALLDGEDVSKLGVGGASVVTPGTASAAAVAEFKTVWDLKTLQSMVVLILFPNIGSVAGVV